LNFAAKIGLLLVGLVLLAIVGVCGWVFLYTRELPDFTDVRPLRRDGLAPCTGSPLAVQAPW